MSRGGTQRAELSAADIAELIALEESMWRQETRFDPDFQQRRFAQDFFEFGRSGRIYSREEAVLAAPFPIPAQLPLANLAVRALGRDVVQITYDSVVAFETGTEFAHRSSLWSRSPGGWVLRFHQGTPFRP